MALNKTSSETLLNERIVEQRTHSLSAFFRKKSEQLQDSIGYGGSTLYPQEKIAEKLNISVDQLRQKIYQKKPLTRDWLIAICAAYGLDDYDTSEALSICNMPTLDDISNREEFIVGFLRSHKNKPASVNDFNTALEAAGLPVLDINYRKGKKGSNQENIKPLPYKEIRPRVVRTYGDEGDPYDSLATQYLPDMRCVAAAFVEDKSNDQILLEAFSDGSFHISRKGNPLPTILTSPETTDPYYVILIELATLVRKEKQRLDDIVNDTKNYRSRFSANIKRDRIHVFYEEFNYSMPERNEYLMMEYIEGQYVLSIAHQSMFMQEYLSEDDYYLHYHSVTPIPRRSYSSIESIEQRFSETGKDHFYPELIQYRKGAYKRLKKIVEEKLQSILRRELFIQHFDTIWDNPYDVLRYYNIEQNFECSYEPEYGEIYTEKESADFIQEDGTFVTLSFDEIKRAFEIGIVNISELCRIKRVYGSIDYILS